MAKVQLYKDMSKYQFLHYENAYNIGWHENENPLIFDNTNYIDDVFLEKLKIHCETPFNRERSGKHRVYIIDGKKYAKGFGEIRILDLDKGIRYAAPNIIFDDIIDRLYIPSQEFVAAVKRAPLPTDMEYTDFLSRYSKENFWGESKESVNNINNAILLSKTRKSNNILKNIKI